MPYCLHYSMDIIVDNFWTFFQFQLRQLTLRRHNSHLSEIKDNFPEHSMTLIIVGFIWFSFILRQINLYYQIYLQSLRIFCLLKHIQTTKTLWCLRSSFSQEHKVYYFNFMLRVKNYFSNRLIRHDGKFIKNSVHKVNIYCWTF